MFKTFFLSFSLFTSRSDVKRIGNRILKHIETFFSKSRQFNMDSLFVVLQILLDAIGILKQIFIENKILVLSYYTNITLKINSFFFFMLFLHFLLWNSWNDCSCIDIHNTHIQKSISYFIVRVNFHWNWKEEFFCALFFIKLKVLFNNSCFLVLTNENKKRNKATFYVLICMRILAIYLIEKEFFFFKFAWILFLQ